MNNYRFILEPYKGMKSRYTCPSCNHRNEFTRYIDSKTGEYLPDEYGKCNRSNKCNYHLNPYHDGYSQKLWEQEKADFGRNHRTAKFTPLTHRKERKPISSIALEPFTQSLKSYEQNNFIKYLIKLFGIEITTDLISRYFIGTSKHRNGANIFWQIDISGRIRTGKIMLYNPHTGKRTDYVTWTHKIVKQPEFHLKQCFFAEHLLKDKTKPIAIVESEKTAIISSVYFPQFVWIAAGNLHGLNAEKCEVLRGRQVILYPDLSKPKVGNPTAFEVWSNKAKEFSNIASFTVNELLEGKAADDQRKEGCDLADYLINFDYKRFIEPEIIQAERIEQIQRETFISEPVIWKPLPTPLPIKEPAIYKPETKIPISWSQQIDELEKYFSAILLPAKPVKLNPCSTITDCSLFIESHFATVKANNGNKYFLPFLNRLQELKQLLTANQY